MEQTKKQSFDKIGWLWLMALTAAAVVCNSLLEAYGLAESPVVFAILLGIALALVGLFIFSLLRNFGDPCRIALLITFLAGLMASLQLHYLYSMHDLGTYYADESCVYDGHLGMIYWFARMRGFPTMNPMTEYNSILLHPPLYHIIAGCFAKVCHKLGLSKNVVLENIQLVNLFFAQGTVLLTGELLRLFGLSSKRCAVGMLFVGLIPIIPLMAAVPNNDMLCYFLMLLCMIFVVRWIYEQRLFHICCIGLSLGGAMAAKLNAALLIPSVAVVFAVVFFKNIKAWKKLLCQFAVFLLLSVPEAVAWPLFHRLAYQIPLNAIRAPELPSLADISIWNRFFLPHGACFESPYYSMMPLQNSNTWLTLLKTFFLDEVQPTVPGTFGWQISYVLLVLVGLLLACGAVRAALYFCRKCRKNAMPQGLIACFFLLVAGIGLISFVQFNVRYPFVCTANARYLLYLLPVIGLGLALPRQRKQPPKS